MSANLQSLSRPTRVAAGDPLHSGTYRESNADARLLIEATTAALAAHSVVAVVEADLEGLVLPRRTEAAAKTVPLPPVAAVLTTTVYLLYIGQEPSAQNIVWTLHHYWTAPEAQTLGLSSWRQGLSRVAANDPDARMGLAYLHTWVSAVVDSAEGFIA